VVSLVLAGGALAADAPVVHVKAVVSDGGVRLEAEANAPFEYTTYRPSESLYVVDLSGVATADPAGARVVASDLVKSYRVLPYSAGPKPVVRVEVLLSQGIEPRVERKDVEDLALVVSRTPDALLAANSKPSTAATAIVPAVAKSNDVDGLSFRPGTIKRVHLAENGGQTDVDISGSGALTYHATMLQGPDRLVLDFQGSRLRTSETHIASNLDPVRAVRLAQFTPEISRVVIDLREPALYKINKAGNTVTVAFASNASLPAAAPTVAAAPTMTANATMADQKNHAQEPTSTGAAVPPPAAVLPVSLTERASALAAPASAAQPAAMASANNTREASPATVPADAAAPAAAATSAADQTQTAVSAPAPKYSGEPISVNLKDVDLRDFFRLIHEISGLNVVVDPSVRGSLTIVLDDVPWDQALDIVLKNNDLDKQLDGNVLRIATKSTLRREAEESRDLAKAQAEAADVITTTRTLSYAKATSLATTLKKFLSSRGDIIADDRSNTLIIRDIPSTMPVIDNLIRQLDRKSQQVQIEARVVEATRQFSREFGTQLAAALQTGNSTVGGAGSVGTSPITHSPAPPFCVAGSCSTGAGTATSGNMPLLTNLGTAAPTSGFSYVFQNGKFALDEIITAAESRGVGKLLSKPSLITQNNEKATVKQGVKIPVQTVINNTVSVQFVDAVLELDVVPQITIEGTVFMDVTVQNDQIDNGIQRVQGIPAIDTQSTETKVTVNDGATVVIGGVIMTNQQTSINDVPFLGSVPVLGNLFKHKTVSSTSQELLFFLTPRILPS
jgi:type IV pilus assembly protein PilQ